MKFENKVVIVTGASSGIGEGVARMFLEEGTCLVGCGIEPKMNIESEKAIYVQADLTDPAQAQNVVDKAVEAFGQVDKLVCCAGVTFIGSLETTSYDSFLREISINLGGVFNMCKAAVKELVKSQDPSIVTIGSDLGVRPIPERIGYCPSKAGVIMLTKCIALEEEYASLYPLHKMGKVSDMANAVRFLSCSEDSGFITGEIMNVCGGSLI